MNKTANNQAALDSKIALREATLIALEAVISSGEVEVGEAEYAEILQEEIRSLRIERGDDIK